MLQRLSVCCTCSRGQARQNRNKCSVKLRVSHLLKIEQSSDLLRSRNYSERSVHSVNGGPFWYSFCTKAAEQYFWLWRGDGGSSGETKIAEGIRDAKNCRFVLYIAFAGKGGLKPLPSPTSRLRRLCCNALFTIRRYSVN